MSNVTGLDDRSSSERQEPRPNGGPDDLDDADTSAETGSLDDKIDQRVMLHMPVDVRSASLAFLAICASIALLRWMEEFIVPVLLGVMVSYALTPLIDRLESWRVPRMAGAGLVMTVLIGSLAFAGYALRGQADDFLGSLPQLAAKVRQSVVGKAAGDDGTFARVQRAATAIEVAAGGGAPTAGPPPDKAGDESPTDVPKRVAKPAASPAPDQGISIRGYLLTGTLGAAAFFGQALVVIFVALFCSARAIRFDGR